MDFPHLRRLVFHLFLYFIIGSLLALFIDARKQLAQYQDQKERLCTGLSAFTLTSPDLYALCTVNPASWFGNLGQ